eukprot:4894294-Heterocapsa_arctica.AAC.1
MRRRGASMTSLPPAVVLELNASTGATLQHLRTAAEAQRRPCGAAARRLYNLASAGRRCPATPWRCSGAAPP